MKYVIISIGFYQFVANNEEQQLALFLLRFQLWDRRINGPHLKGRAGYKTDYFNRGAQPH